MTEYLFFIFFVKKLVDNLYLKYELLGYMNWYDSYGDFNSLQK